jgi:hypothetical protein
MLTTSDYRRRAERCLRLAATTVDTAIAASLRQLAADNLAMAEEGKAHVAQQPQQIQPRGLERPKASDE